LKNITKDKIEWDAAALKMMLKIPVMVRPMAQRMVEKNAEKDGKTRITKEFVSEVRKNSPMGGSHKHKKLKLEDFYANSDKSPILSGFKRSGGVHAGMSGQPIEIDKLSSIWDEIAEESEQQKQRALYIHIPFCLSRCKFCSFYHTRTNKNQIDTYVDDLMKELEFVFKSKFAKSAPFNAVYFGGGTPTDLSANSFDRILKHLNNNWNLANDCEITVEGRIYGFNNDKISACLENGVNRFSFGVQSFNTKIRRQMGRIESRENILAKLANIASNNQASISVDLIYGFPDQTNEIWKEDIRTVVECGLVDSASIYRLKFLPGSPIEDQIAKGELSAASSLEQQAEQFMISNEYFRSINATRSGVTHWSFTNRERCIYNAIPKYQQTCLPIGCGAGGSAGGYRLMQRMELEEYSAKIAKGEKPIAMGMKIPSGFRLEGAIAGPIELHLGLNLKELSKKSGILNLVDIFSPLLAQWDNAGMVKFNKDAGVMKLTDAGAYHCVSLAQNMIDYYKTQSKGHKKLK